MIIRLVSHLVLLVGRSSGPGPCECVLESSFEDVWKILEGVLLLAARVCAALSVVQTDQGNLDKCQNTLSSVSGDNLKSMPQ